MRTTLTLDDDVAAALERRRHELQHSLKQEVNDLIRAGLTHVEQEQPKTPRCESAGLRPHTRVATTRGSQHMARRGAQRPGKGRLALANATGLRAPDGESQRRQ